MLLAFLYHCINQEKYANSDKMIKKHLTFLKKHYPIVLPGEKLLPHKLQICLSFDDGYFDFYHYIFPLLKELDIRAVLAIPTKCILDHAKKSALERLSILEKNRPSEAFCTWEEIKEMAHSGYVMIASHSHSHENLTSSQVELEKEIVDSKELIEKKIDKKVSTFVYPLGKFNKKVHQMVKNHYLYAFRIGSALNFSWQNLNNITYRIPADSMKKYDALLFPKQFISYLWFYLLNSCRKR